MSVILIRSLILYILVIFAVRLMGKRQLGELQPSELVITILVSNIATLPLEDAGIPLIVGVTPILSLVCFEVLVSWLCMLFPKLRRIISGSPKVVIRGGCIDPAVLRELRLSADDLMTALRTDGIFDVGEVQFAVVETTGSISVMKKQKNEPPSRTELGVAAQCSDPPMLIAAGGQLIPEALRELNISAAEAETVVRSRGLRLDDVFLMSADSSGSYYIADNRGDTPYVVKGDKQR